MENISITITDREGNKRVEEAPLGMNLNIMEFCKALELPVKGTCGGMALCSTCHIYIKSDHDLPTPSDDEENMLDQAFFVKESSRLGCQIFFDENLDGLQIELAPDDDEM